MQIMQSPIEKKIDVLPALVAAHSDEKCISRVAAAQAVSQEPFEGVRRAKTADFITQRSSSEPCNCFST